MLTLLWYPKCSTCRRAKSFLDAAGIPCETRDLTRETPSAQELAAWQARAELPLRRFFNASGLRYRDLGLKDRLPELSEAEQLALLASDGMLIKRPILLGSTQVLLGFREAEWAAHLIENR